MDEIPQEEKPSKVELTDGQKLLILNEWNNRPENPPSIPELIKLCFPSKIDKELDSRTFAGRAIREYLASRQIQVKKAGQYTPLPPLELTPEQKEYVSNNCSMMKGTELAEAIFNIKGQTNLSRETKVVLEYLRTVDKRVKLYQNIDDIPEGGYSPPKSLSRVLTRINKYAEGIQELKEETLKDRQKKDCYNLIGFLHNYRFVHQISTYAEQADRDLMESTFINYVWDKPDLTAEEVDQYVVLATEKVIASSILQQIEKLRKMLDNITDGEDAKVSMSLVELISSSRTEYNQCILRQEKLLNALKGTRANRLGNKIKENATILNIVQDWRNEETRKLLIQEAEERKASLKEECERINVLDSMKARWMGMSVDEIING